GNRLDMPSGDAARAPGRRVHPWTGGGTGPAIQYQPRHCADRGRSASRLRARPRRRGLASGWAAVRNWRSIAAVSGLIVLACVLAAWPRAHRWPLATSPARARDAALSVIGKSRLPADIQNDAAGRTPVACPPAGGRTMIALVFGQSQAANLVKERFTGDDGVFNYFAGHCYRATDPLLGTDYDGGNVWTLVGNELVRQRLFDAVVLVTAAVSGSYIGQWAPGGRLHAHLLGAVNSVGPDLAFTHVFVQQGEADLMARTPEEEYFARFAGVIAALREGGIGAPI